MSIKVQDYLIDQDGIDWPRVLSDWSWLLPPMATVWLVNRFADLFLILEDGSVHMLDVGAGTLCRVAESRDDFDTPRSGYTNSPGNPCRKSRHGQEMRRSSPRPDSRPPRPPSHPRLSAGPLAVQQDGLPQVAVPQQAGDDSLPSHGVERRPADQLELDVLHRCVAQVDRLLHATPPRIVRPPSRAGRPGHSTSAPSAPGWPCSIDHTRTTLSIGCPLPKPESSKT